MKEQNSQFHQTPREHAFRNGSTQPPRSYGGPVAFLLVAVIFFSGIFCALGLLNIRIHNALAHVPASPAVFQPGPGMPLSDDGLTAPSETDTVWSALGISGNSVPEVYQQYYELPAGVCISQVTEHSPGDLAGLFPGDILLGVNDRSVRNAEDLTHVLSTCPEGRTVHLLIYRNEETIVLPVTLRS